MRSVVAFPISLPVRSGDSRQNGGDPFYREPINVDSENIDGRRREVADAILSKPKARVATEPKSRLGAIAFSRCRFKRLFFLSTRVLRSALARHSIGASRFRLKHNVAAAIDSQGSPEILRPFPQRFAFEKTSFPSW